MKGCCNCGAVSFSIQDELPNFYQCHCSLCQKQGGSTSNTATIITKQNFKWLSGEDSITQWKKESGFSSHFCSFCGSPAPNQLRETDYYWIPTGLLENVSSKVVIHIYCDSKAPWDTLSANCRQEETMPESFSEFVEILTTKKLSAQ